MKAGRAIKNMPYGRASRIAQSAAMEDMPQVISALRNAPPGATVAEVTSNIKNPAWHALVQESLERDPAGARFLSRITAMTDAEATNALTKLAGGQTAAQVRGTILADAPESLVSVVEFDRYQGKGIPEGKISLALRLTYQSHERTLTDAEVEAANNDVVGVLSTSLGAVRR